MTYQIRKACLAAATAVAVAAASTVAPAPALADDSSAASPAQQEGSTAQKEYDGLIEAVKSEVDKAEKAIGELKPKATKQKNDWGYDAAFEALNRLDDAQMGIDNIKRILDVLPSSPNDRALVDLRQARKMSFTLNQKISDAKFNIDLAQQIHDDETVVPVECKDAIDVGDTSGSSTGSSTTGFFNPLGNRVVYSKEGLPSCTTNLEFFSGKLLGLASVLVSAASFIGGIAKFFNQDKQPSEKKKDETSGGQAPAPEAAPAG